MNTTTSGITGTYGGFEVRGVETREELVGLPKQPHVPFDIGERTELAAETLAAMFGWDKKSLTDTIGPKFRSLYDALADEHRDTDAAVETLPGLWVVDERGLTLSGVVRGHDVLTGKRSGKGVPETTIWPEMWRGRSADYANQRLRTVTVLSRFGQTAFAGLAMLLGGDRTDSPGLRLTRKNWQEQQTSLDVLLDEYNTGHRLTAAEAINPVDWLVLDGQRIVADQSRLDGPTFTRFVQHSQDVSFHGDSCGPGACVRDSQASLDGSRGSARSGEGVRVLVGPKS